MSDISPWHDGERTIHRKMGTAERMEEHGRRVIRDFMPDQHRDFFAQLPFLILATMDEIGQPWAGLISGRPGFVTTPDAKHLVASRLPDSSDPLWPGLKAGAAIAMIGIDLATRRRNRLNGTVLTLNGQGLLAGVRQSFGNCPKYIQKRALEIGRDPSRSQGTTVERGDRLDEEAAALIGVADTAFIASGVPGALDVSHRGGKPGFIRVVGNRLTIPDFSGNGYFNTLGNLLIQPKAGLLFIDFLTGDLLHLSGNTSIEFDGPEIAKFAGAERVWHFDVTAMIRRRDATALRWRFEEFSPFIP